MEEPKPYVVVEGIELNDLERKVNQLIAEGYAPQPMVVAPPMSGATSRPRYVVPMVLTRSHNPLAVLADIGEEEWESAVEKQGGIRLSVLKERIGNTVRDALGG